MKTTLPSSGFGVSSVERGRDGDGVFIAIVGLVTNNSPSLNILNIANVLVTRPTRAEEHSGCILYRWFQPTGQNKSLFLALAKLSF
jgi:hypothetical protein